MTDEGAKRIAEAIRYLADSLHPGRGTGTDATGGTVGSVSEAIMGMTAALVDVAKAIDGIKDEKVATAVAAAVDDLKRKIEAEIEGEGA